jgi:hypothetical protein
MDPGPLLVVLMAVAYKNDPLEILELARFTFTHWLP